MAHFAVTVDTTANRDAYMNAKVELKYATMALMIIVQNVIILLARLIELPI
jgi:hypothetical protein